jgi:hypothetical protein
MPPGGVGSPKRCLAELLLSKKFKYEKVIKMKNEPNPGISRTYYLSNKTIGMPLYSLQIA